MRDFDMRFVPSSGLVLMTAPELDEGPMFIADFRDAFALAYKGTGHFVGFSRSGVLKLGRRPVRMAGGVWVMDEWEGNQDHQEVTLSPDVLSLEPIEAGF